MRKTIRLKDLVPKVEAMGYLPAEAKKIVLKGFDSIVRSFHVTVLTAINKIKFLKYSNSIINALEARVKRENQNQGSPTDQIRNVIKQSTESTKVNDYMKEKFARVLSLRSGSVIIFQYTDLNGQVTNRMGFVVGGSEGPEKVYFTSKSNEVFVRVIDISKSNMSDVYDLIKSQSSIRDDDSGESPDITFGDAILNPRYKRVLSYDNFRSFNANRINYLSTLKFETTK